MSWLLSAVVAIVQLEISHLGSWHSEGNSIQNFIPASPSAHFPPSAHAPKSICHIICSSRIAKASCLLPRSCPCPLPSGGSWPYILAIIAFQYVWYTFQGKVDARGSTQASRKVAECCIRVCLAFAQLDYL